MSIDEKLSKLEQLRAETEKGGGEERLKAQHARGKLSARERLNLLLTALLLIDRQILVWLRERSSEMVWALDMGQSMDV